MPHEPLPHNPAMSFPGGETSAPSKLTSIWFDQIDLAARQDYLIKNVLPAGGLSVLYGPPGCGKSFLATDMAFSVARNVPWFGHRVLGGGVVYVAAEGQGGFKKRITAYRQAHLCEGETGIPFRLVPMQLELLTGPDKGELIKLIEEGSPGRQPIRLVVIDTLARTLTGGDENDSADMSRYIANMASIQAATGAHVCIVHHTGKNTANGARGHSSLLGAVDTAMEIAREGETRTATLVKQKDGKDGDAFAFALAVHDLGEDQDGDTITSCTIEPKVGIRILHAAKLSPTTRRARDLLVEAINTAGQTPPASPHIPNNAQAVNTDLWREYCYKGGLTASSEANTKRKTFNRARQDLIAAGIVGTWDDWVWAA